jgi:pyruvate phosphate dikinase-like enzyme/lamin tail-like protein
MGMECALSRHMFSSKIKHFFFVLSAIMAVITLAACGETLAPLITCEESDGICPGQLKINELMPKNDGAWVDETGETGDWLELVNTSSESLALAGYYIGDSISEFHHLPNLDLGPGEVILLWIDKKPEKGHLHLPFKLSSQGETVYLRSPDDRLIDRVSFPSAQANDSYARFPNASGPFEVCRWASPTRSNGETCEPPPPNELPGEIEFEPFTWPDPWPITPSPLALSELALHPADFIEVVNTSDTSIELSDYTLTVSSHAPGLAWPTISSGTQLDWPIGSLAAGERLIVEVVPADIATISADPNFEGVVTIFENANSEMIDRVDFMAWPNAAALARVPDILGRHTFCATHTPGQANDICDQLQSRPVTDRLRHLRTEGDFAKLAEGGAALGIESVKYIVDMQAGYVVHLLSSHEWDLHYTFVRELVEGLEHLDRCIPSENQLFHSGWAQFSRDEYYDVEGRRYLLGTLVRYAGNSIKTMEFTTGDRIIASQMFEAFFTVARHLLTPADWALRPQSSRQFNEMLLFEGHAPIIDPNAPFRELIFQPLTEGLAYGILKFVSEAELENTALGPQVIVVTDQVPNDIPLVGGLITETFQTPLAHVNVLSRNRGTPNMALRQARSQQQIADHLGSLVRLEVNSAGFNIRPADLAEAEEFWESIRPSGDPLYPRLDTNVRGAHMLVGKGIDNLPSLGAKAAQLAELGRIYSTREGCLGSLNTPQNSFAIPLVHSLEHYSACGADVLLAQFEDDPLFLTDPQVRDQKLFEIRQVIMNHPVEQQLLKEVSQLVDQLFGHSRVRFRSSSNIEDLEGFNGAGLYTSISAEIGDSKRTIEDALRTVWASLYNTRAYDERRFHNVDESSVAMGILVHQAFLSERANGVAISRNILNPIRSDEYYLNSQVGEASVTNPAPGVSTEQVIYRRGRTPRVVYQAVSSLPGGIPVLDSGETEKVACTLGVIHDHFQTLLDPQGENRWFAMDIEIKLVGSLRNLLVKQARPYTFGNAEVSPDCREF